MKIKVKSVIALLLASLLITACSVDDGIRSAEDLFGLGMGSKDDGQSTVITYRDDKSENDDLTSAVASEANEEEKDKGNDADKEIDETNEETALLEETEEVTIYDDVNKRYSKTALTKGQITLSFVGDVTLYDEGSVLAKAKSNADGFKGCFDETMYNYMAGVDIFMLNNEFPFSSGGSRLVDKKYTFRSHPDNVKYLDEIGTDIVSLANNHVYDYGPQALADTVDVLNAAKMPFVGAGKNIDEAMKPAYFYVDGKVIAIVAGTQIEGFANPETKEATSSSPGVLRCLDTTKIKQVIKEADENADFVICFIHWGREKSDQIMEWQKTEARDMVEAGADFIVGAHAHCLQGIDYIDGVPVVYGMGNYLFNRNTQDTCLINLTLDSSAKDDVSIKSIKFVPCIMSGSTVRVADSDEWSRIIHYEQGISFHAAIDEEGFVTYSETDNNTQHGQNTSPMRESEVKEDKKED